MKVGRGSLKPVIKSVKKRGRPPGDTREKIVARSIVLFNRRGVASVSIGAIAANMKISPGNLTYHFKRKNDLVQACLDVLHQRLRIGMERPVLASAQDAAVYTIAGLKTLWEFRFFFNALTYLLSSDRKMRRDYYEFRDWAINQVAMDLQRLSELGYVRIPDPPNSLHMLVNCLWSQWLNWLRMQQIENPTASTPSGPALYDCAVHIWSMCQPYLEARFSHDLWAALGKTLSVKSGRQSRQLGG